MPLFNDIQTLEQKLQQVLQGTESYTSVENFREAYTEGILRALGEDFSNDELSAVDLDKIVKEALNDAADFIDTGLAAEIQADVETIVGDTIAFYNEQGIVLPELLEAIERREAVTRLTEEFTTNMGSMRDELLDKTVEVMTENVAKGNISLADMSDSILEAADGQLHHARTNARMVVSAYNRIGRDQVRRDAGLEHAYYYGDRRTNTRIFCVRCIGRVFSLEQIERMANGQGLDVKLYCGGWNCIHSWLWMEPDWDPELQKRFDGERSVVDVEDAGLKLKVPERDG